jgi:hypothetical protein
MIQSWPKTDDFEFEMYQHQEIRGNSLGTESSAVVLTESPKHLRRITDAETGLGLIDLSK